MQRESILIDWSRESPMIPIRFGIIPIMDNLEAAKKDLLQISTDWSNVMFEISRLVTSQNMLLPITIDFNNGYLLSENSVSPVVSNVCNHKSSTSIGIEFSSVWFFTTKLVEEGDLSPKLM